MSVESGEGGAVFNVVRCDPNIVNRYWMPFYFQTTFYFCKYFTRTYVHRRNSDFQPFQESVKNLDVISLPISPFEAREKFGDNDHRHDHL